jgi:UDP-glucose 4-epimerase
MKAFKDKTLLITGGTGSFGNAVLRRFIKNDIGLKEIRIFSRDEKKQDDMRKMYNDPRLKFYIGDVRKRESVDNAMRGVDFIFHAAALKQVPCCEFFPMEATQTNIVGTHNVIRSATAAGVSRIICLSTDKAAYPINAMGVSKALMEKVAAAEARAIGDNGPVICRTRYGNVMASRGSVIPLFLEQISEGKPLTVTNGEMTRFMMTLDDAVDLVMYAFEHGKQGDLFVQKAPAATVNTLAKAILDLTDSKVGIKDIGVRHGEKDHEVLVTREEMQTAKDFGRYYRVPLDARDLNYNLYFTDGNPEKKRLDSYDSDNTERLDVTGMKKLLKKLVLFGGSS